MPKDEGRMTNDEVRMINQRVLARRFHSVSSRAAETARDLTKTARASDLTCVMDHRRALRLRSASQSIYAEPIHLRHCRVPQIGQRNFLRE